MKILTSCPATESYQLHILVPETDIRHTFKCNFFHENVLVTPNMGLKYIVCVVNCMKSALTHEMAWHRMATSHYLNQCRKISLLFAGASYQ